VATLLSACAAPNFQKFTETVSNPALEDNYFIAHDGEHLPIRTWKSNNPRPRAIIIAVHGFNDYSNFFKAPGSYLAKKNITTYAFDQRGFGAAPKPGLWPGVTALTNDLMCLTSLIQARHPEIPLYLLGESMGGGVVMVTLKKAREQGQELGLSGVILSAPAIWGRQFMPWYQTTALWVAAHTLPRTKLTGQGLKITASDNIAMLRALSSDPLVIKKTRIDAMYGLTNLMDQALESAWELNEPLLVLYGKKDEVIPRKPTMEMLTRLPEKAKATRKIIFYGNGYHMLMRDLQAETVWRDIISWIEARNKQLLVVTQRYE
jgi:alpha-beta hydrolase superfamily lysophospholipase